jgi:hypothetical protein
MVKQEKERTYISKIAVYMVYNYLQWAGGDEGSHQCCGSGSGHGSGSARIRNFLQDPDLEPELVVMDPDLALGPELDLNLTKNHQKNLQFDNYDIKNKLILYFY